MTFVSSDLHGYPADGFWRLLEAAGFSDADELIILGDVIDRNGDGGIAFLCWLAMRPNARLIMGNHEAMLLSCRFLFDVITEQSVEALDKSSVSLLANWLSNGAEPTIQALRALFHEDAESALGLIEYLEDAPLFEIVPAGGRRYLLTHAGLGNFSAEKPLEAYKPEELLWHRPALTDEYFPDMTTVFGHTPTQYYGAEYKGRMLRTPTWLNIDTGAAGGGKPMLLRLDDEREFYL